ncbi:MAG: undecaprenyl-diphosphatase UppP [Chloroflexi bacterium]|nr:MAG: undecaprenyl-diphosphatase UppP [Anaerolineaceae bacterium 4572_32.2]RLC78520.1 MAG: undecaprenyl-diphosphatase UppP [Chloroflexota bacterium]RLC84362.1 MAG: undecaprenyl-diphosphatase UppP [Chloroflexota bacterium]HEY71989.1 undecaprenyl-diphosphatase UppP [Thermoflexia bacterium]
MNLFQAFFLGVLQGATEFLPVSSSGHLVLAPWLLGWDSPGLAFDAVVHWGTALAVVVYFWRDWVAIVRAAFRSLLERSLEDSQARLAWFILLGTIPAALIGYLLEDFFEGMFARPVAAAGFLLITAAILAASERLGRRERDLDTLTWLDALLVGLAQALAILPGISRSGSTIAAGLARGLRRELSARFSFLLATPIILGAGLLKVVGLARMGGLAAQAPALVVGFVTAGLVGFGCIHFLMGYLQRRRLYPFAVYCAVAGAVCLFAALARGV